MVKEIDAGARNVRDVILEFRSIHGNMRLLKFPQGSIDGTSQVRERRALDDLAKIPDFDLQSFLVKNAIGSRDSRVDLLLIPNDCPEIAPSLYKDEKRLPKNDETWIVESWHFDNEQNKFRIFVLEEDPSSVVRIARREASNHFNCFRRDIKTSSRKVSPKVFREEVKRDIDNGFYVPPHILDSCGLKGYFESKRYLRSR